MNDPQQNTIRMTCHLDRAGTITIDASALPRDTVQQILALILGQTTATFHRYPDAIDPETLRLFYGTATMPSGDHA